MQTLQGNNLSPGNRNCVCSLKTTWHDLTKTSPSNPLGILRVITYCPKCLLLVLSLLFTGAIIWASRKLAGLIKHNTAWTALIQWNIPLPFCHRVGQNVPVSYFFYFSYISRLYMFTFRIAIVSRFLPNIMVIEWIFFNVGSIFP